MEEVDSKMVAAQLMLVNHFFLSLTHNSADVPVFPDINSVVVDMGCSHGCTRCSPLNGCLSCKPPFFLVLHRDGVRQKASCSRSCPRGFYKMKKKRSGFCTKCSMRGCEACVGPRYCSACNQHYINFFGTCIRQTPDNELEELRNFEKHLPHLFPAMMTNGYKGDSGGDLNSTISISNSGVHRDSRVWENSTNYSEFNTSHSNPMHSRVNNSSSDVNDSGNVSKSDSNNNSSTSISTTNTTVLPSSPTKATQHPSTTVPPPSLPSQPPHSPPPQLTTNSTSPISIPVNPCRYWRRKWGRRGRGKRRREHRGRRRDRGRRRNKHRRLMRKHGREELSSEERYLRKICRRRMRKRRRRRKKTQMQTQRLGDESTSPTDYIRREGKNHSSETVQEEARTDIEGSNLEESHSTAVSEMIDLSLLEEGLEEGKREEVTEERISKDSHRRFHRKFIYKNRPRAMAAFKQSKKYRRAKPTVLHRVRHGAHKRKLALS